jgi:hypothetical protein
MVDVESDIVIGVIYHQSLIQTTILLILLRKL